MAFGYTYFIFSALLCFFVVADKTVAMASNIVPKHLLKKNVSADGMLKYVNTEYRKTKMVFVNSIWTF